MGEHATGTFEIDGWDEVPYDERDGTRLARARVTKTFSGDVEGTSAAELLMAYVADDGVAYVGLERIVGKVHGRSGGFVLHHTAGPAGAGWTIVPGTGTGELEGIVGEATITIEPGGGHSFAVDYDLA